MANKMEAQARRNNGAKMTNPFTSEEIGDAISELSAAVDIRIDPVVLPLWCARALLSALKRGKEGQMSDTKSLPLTSEEIEELEGAAQRWLSGGQSHPDAWRMARALPRLLYFLKRGKEEAYEETAKVADQYTRLSPLHNYGPPGASRAERESMQTARFIADDIRALSPKDKNDG